MELIKDQNIFQMLWSRFDMQDTPKFIKRYKKIIRIFVEFSRDFEHEQRCKNQFVVYE
jgi:hypothetical protein